MPGSGLTMEQQGQGHAHACPGPPSVPGTNITVLILMFPKFSSVFKSCFQVSRQPYKQR